jgi:hypothetical protein
MFLAQGIDKVVGAGISAIRFMNGSFCFFFQKEALWFRFIPLDGAGSPRRRGRLAMTKIGNFQESADGAW